MKHNRIKELEQVIRGEHANITGVVVRKNGERVYEAYFQGYTSDHTGHIFSVTKSVFSALVGIALEKGFLKSLEQRVLEFFPDFTVPEGEKTAQLVTIRDMLTMTAPYRYDTEPYETFFMSDNWTKFALEQLGGNGRIGNFSYSAMVGTHILSAVLTKATGRSNLDFATEFLFSPLGVCVHGNVMLRTREEHVAAMSSRSTSGWAVDAQGVNPAGWGLFLSAADMAKIGQLYANGGTWEGKQILSAQWIQESIRVHSCWQEMGLPYGYLWWILDEQQGAFAAMGDGGNVIYVNREQNLVVAIAAVFAEETGDRIRLMKELIVPIFANGGEE